MDLIDLLPQAATQIYIYIETSKYILLWLGCYFEGTLVMITGGVLLRFHEATFWILYPVLVSSDVLADITWYGIGYYGARPFVERWGNVIGVGMPVIEKIERGFRKYHTRILAVSKLTMGFGLAAGTLLTAGLLRVSFMRFVVINFLGSLIWVLFLIVIGYNFGNVIDLIPKEYRIAGFIAIITAFFFGVRLLSQRLAQFDW